MVLDRTSSQEYSVNAFQDSILGPTFFPIYINDLPDDFILNIAIYANDTTLYSKCNLASAMRFPSFEVAWYVLAGTLNCCLDMLEKSQKWICRTVDPMFAVSLELIANHRNIGGLSFLFMYYFSRCSSELAELVPLPYSDGSSTRYSNSLNDFSATNSRCYEDIYNSFSPSTAKL